METPHEIREAIALLETNLDRYERLQDPTSEEVSMYRSLWETYCNLKDKLLVVQIIADEVPLSEVGKN